jgi:hypothetical protein
MTTRATSTSTSVKPLCPVTLLANTLLAPTKGIPLGLEIGPGADQLLPPQLGDLNQASRGNAPSGIGVAPVVAELNVKVRERGVEGEGAGVREHEIGGRRRYTGTEVAVQSGMLLQDDVVLTDRPVGIAIHKHGPACAQIAARNAGAGTILRGAQCDRDLPLESLATGGVQTGDQIVGRAAHAVIGSEGGEEGRAETEGNAHDGQHEQKLDEAEARLSFLFLF